VVYRLLLACVCGCAIWLTGAAFASQTPPDGAPGVRTPSSTDGGQYVITPESLKTAAEYSAKTDGHAFMVVQRGEVLIEEYQNGHTAERPHRLASGTKSFSGLIAMCAVEDGLLTLDEPVAKTITEWSSDPRLSKVTIRHLLTLSSGFKAPPMQNPPAYAVAVKEEIDHDPGSQFSYGPVPYQIFGEVMQRKLDAKGETLPSYFERRLLGPIGMKTGPWRGWESGEPQLPSGCTLTAREWAKLGALVLAKGTVGDSQVVKPESLREMLTPSAANPRYAMTWWVNIEPGKAYDDPAAKAAIARDGESLPASVMAAGAGKQCLVIVPSMELVVVRFGDSQEFDHGRALRLLLGVPAGADGEGEDGEPVEGRQRRLQAMFEQLDEDGNGTISREEFARAPSGAMLSFDEADADADGALSLAEIRRAALRRRLGR
jgi:CubicO group peptidase (beta-lactamase class C family)